jgi:hypothetical protein
MVNLSDPPELINTYVENIFNMANLIDLKQNLGTYRVESLDDVRASIKKIMSGTYNTKYCDICSISETQINEKTKHILFKFVHFSVATMATEPYWLITLTTDNTASTDSCMTNYLARAKEERDIEDRVVIVEMIDIVDNSGTEESTTDPDEIAKVLNDPETWTDDIWFLDSSKNQYSIDDLIRKTVIVGDHTILVIE